MHVTVAARESRVPQMDVLARLHVNTHLSSLLMCDLL